MIIPNNNIVEFIKGIGQIIDIRGSYTKDIEDKYRYTSEQEFDANAIYSDWLQVGNDIRTSMEQYDKNKPTTY